MISQDLKTHSIQRKARIIFVYLFALSHIVISHSSIAESAIAAPLAAEKPAEEAAQKKLLARLPQACHLSGSYSQTKTLQDVATPVKSEGSFLYSCKHGLVWHTQTPIVETLIYGKKTSNTKIDAQGQEHTLKKRLHRYLNTLLNGLIGADTEYLNKYFSISSHENTIQLTPKKRRMRKFIRVIDIDIKNISKNEISKDEEGKASLITLNFTSGQSTQMYIFDHKTYSSLNTESCESLKHIRPAACKILFK